MFSFLLNFTYGVLAFFLVFLVESFFIKLGLPVPNRNFSAFTVGGLYIPAFLEELVKISFTFLAVYRLKNNFHLTLGIPIGFGFVESYFSPEKDTLQKIFLHTIFWGIGYLIAKNIKTNKKIQFAIWLIISSIVHFGYNMVTIFNF